ncbi:hypothetical protein IWQ60_007921 [Tieghemiomyces parasiticus]|uniref:F-box domain-containing protein n=1 Tax=Tieghemiomyces parasiticus TaxID=78921 RepID=A0A9W8DMT5_9FUNG|nr:hypothetical protein IWQ60_007921 [Tieghemiomyces parasiticus]
MDFPAEVLRRIFRECGRPTLRTACLVNRNWREHAEVFLYHDPLIQDMRQFVLLTSQGSDHALRRHVRTISVELVPHRWDLFGADSLATLARRCPNLTHLNLDECHIDDEALRALLVAPTGHPHAHGDDKSASGHSLANHNATGRIPNRQPVAATVLLPHLEYLSLQNCPIGDRCGDVIHHLRNLRHLDVSHTHITDKAFIRIVRSCTALELVFTNTCCYLSERSFHAAFASLPRLKELDIENCYNIVEGLLPNGRVHSPSWVDDTEDDWSDEDVVDEFDDGLVLDDRAERDGPWGRESVSPDFVLANSRRISGSGRASDTDDAWETEPDSVL